MISEGKLLAASKGETYVLKLVGDVRVPLCKTLDDCVESICDEGFEALTIDFSDADNADSTTLGLIAKLCIKAKQQCQVDPMIYSPNDDMSRLLDTMGFESICELVHVLPDLDNCGDALECEHQNCEEEEIKRRVIEAHKILIQLCDGNAECFSDLVRQLEAP